VFCGFCRDTDGLAFFGVCVGGSNAGAVCQQPNECPGGTCDGEAPCVSDADCVQPRERCEQRYNCAFGFDEATTISETGAPAGSLVDRTPKQGTLVTSFCIPPSYAPPIDVVSSLPGPGATALPSQLQLLPLP
jgi:hypothetical protein